MVEKKTWKTFKGEFLADCQKEIDKISKEYGISEEQAGCYLCNFEDDYICTIYNGGCKAYTLCKNIHDNEVKNN